MKKNNITKILDRLYHNYSISELQLAYDKKNFTDLTYHDVLYLNIIDAYPNKYTSSQIADLLKVSRPAVTQKINDLSEKGYIIRTKSLSDKRFSYLKTNPEKNYYPVEIKDEELLIMEKLEEKYGNANIEKFCEILSDFVDLAFEKNLGEKNE